MCSRETKNIILPAQITFISTAKLCWSNSSYKFSSRYFLVSPRAEPSQGTAWTSLNFFPPARPEVTPAGTEISYSLLGQHQVNRGTQISLWIILISLRTGIQLDSMKCSLARWGKLFPWQSSLLPIDTDSEYSVFISRELKISRKNSEVLSETWNWNSYRSFYFITKF